MQGASPYIYMVLEKYRQCHSHLSAVGWDKVFPNILSQGASLRVLNRFMHSKMRFKQYKFVLSAIIDLSDSGDSGRQK